MIYYIGIDLGGTNTAVGLVDENFGIVCKTSFKTNSPRSAESICDDIAEAVDEIVKKSGVSRADIKGAGAACPGIIKHGIIRFASNLKFNDVPFASLLEERLKMPSAICNDAQAAALAECLVGCGKGCESLVAVTIGTGIGGGIILGKKIHDGFNGAGAEIGHMTLIPDGRLCSCGNRGCFETYCSAKALVNDTKEAMLKHHDSALWQVCPDISKVDGNTVFDAADMGDEVANEVLDSFYGYLSLGVYSIISLLQPEVVCIGGGMSARGKVITDPVAKLVNEKGIMTALSEKPLITAAKLHNDAGIIGAAEYIARGE